MKERAEIRVGVASDLPQGIAASFMAGSEPGVLFRSGNEFFAVRNRCPHQQFEKLHEGEIEGTTVTCPMHGWKFDVRTGMGVKAGRLKTWKTAVREGVVMVECDAEC